MTNTENPIPIPVPEWLQVHHRVVPFIDGDERRGHGMVLLTTHDGRRRWVGTDYARLVVLDGGCQESEVTALLSHRLICAAVQLGEPEGDAVELSIEPDGAGGRAACTLGAGPARVTLPGRCPVFPDWESVAHDPQEIAAMATVDRDTFRTLLDEARHAPGGTDLDGQVPLCWLDVGLDGLRIEVTWSCFGLSTFALSCPTSGRTRVPVNPRFLHELLNASGEGELRLTFGQEPSDLLVFAAADGWTGYLAPIDASAEAVRPKVEHVIGGAFGIEPERDEDGDYLLTADPVPVYARLISGEPHRLRLFALVAGVSDDIELLKELNEQNQHLPFVRVNLAGRIVSYEYEIDVSAPSFGEQVLAESCSRVAEAAARFGPLLEARFGERGSADGSDPHDQSGGGSPTNDAK